MGIRETCDLLTDGYLPCGILSTSPLKALLLIDCHVQIIWIDMGTVHFCLQWIKCMDNLHMQVIHSMPCIRTKHMQTIHYLEINML